MPRECWDPKTSVRADYATIYRDWSEPDGRWFPVSSAAFEGWHGLAVSLSAQPKNGETYNGRLAARLEYTSRSAQVIEIDFCRVVTVCLPANGVKVSARLERPYGVALALPDEEVIVGVEISQLEFSCQRDLHRSQGFADPANTSTLVLPVPPGAYAVMWSPSSPTNNVASIQLATLIAPGIYQAIAEVPSREGYSPVPSASQVVIITGGSSGASPSVVHSLQYLIQPLR